MSDKSENLPDETAGTVEGLDFTAEQLLQELSQYFNPGEERMQGDLTLEMMAAYYHISVDNARKNAYKLVKQGLLRKVPVCGENGRRIVVYRKV